MENKAEIFINDWISLYEQSLGEITEPDFKGIDKNYSDAKKIPYYVFDDLSLIIVIINYFGKVNYIVCNDVDELDHEWNHKGDHLGNEYAVFNIFTL